MTNLLQCPFCGGSAEICFHQATGIAWVRCMDCDTSTSASTDLNKAIEFWNGRYERTCENKAPRYLDFLCSKCGFVHYIDDSNCTGDGNEWNYCPNCGAKVIEHETV